MESPQLFSSLDDVGQVIEVKRMVWRYEEEMGFGSGGVVSWFFRLRDRTGEVFANRLAV